MTDNEIIKALELCIEGGDGSCTICPYANTPNCYAESGKDILNLINRQRAEIERLQQIVGAFPKVNMQDLNFVRAKATKEFAERLKAVITINNTHDGYLDYAVDYNCLMEDINDLIKEIVGEEK